MKEKKLQRKAEVDGTLLWLHVEFLMDKGMRQERLENSNKEKKKIFEKQRTRGQSQHSWEQLEQKQSPFQ